MTVKFVFKQVGKFLSSKYDPKGWTNSSSAESGTPFAPCDPRLLVGVGTLSVRANKGTRAVVVILAWRS